MVSSIIIGAVVLLLIVMPLIFFLDAGWELTAIAYVVVMVGGFAGYIHWGSTQLVSQEPTTVTITVGEE